MKKIILFTSCLFVFVFANGQTPTFEWAKSMGGASGVVAGYSITLDTYGNIYTTGQFGGVVDFDPGPGVYNLTATGGGIFISKLDPFGNFIWAKTMNGNYSAYGFSIALDNYGNIYTTGCFVGTVDFDPNVGTFNLTSSSTSNDIFILKLDASGNFVWAKNIEGATNSTGIAYSITLDVTGNIFTSGRFDRTVDFDPSIGIDSLTSYSGNDIFILKLDTNGNYMWAKNIGGTSGGGYGCSIKADVSGNVYTTGYFQGTIDCDPSVGIFNLTSAGYNDIFILKLDASGNFIWVKQMGGIYDDYGSSIELDTAGNVYTTGYFSGTVDFDPGIGIFNLTFSDMMGNSDMFISKLDASGNFIWAKHMDGVSANVKGLSITSDEEGNIYTTGYFYGTADFDPGSGTDSLTSSSSSGGYDLFISKLDALGNFVWVKSIQKTVNIIGFAIAVDIAANVYATGWFQGVVDFGVGSGIDSLVSLGTTDLFVIKLSQTPTGIYEETTNSSTISIYPNPNNGIFNISISTQIKNASIEVYNSLGALVYKKEITNQENSIELSNQTNGLYFVKVMSENKIVGTGKIIKE